MKLQLPTADQHLAHHNHKMLNLANGQRDELDGQQTKAAPTDGIDQ